MPIGMLTHVCLILEYCLFFKGFVKRTFVYSAVGNPVDSRPLDGDLELTVMPHSAAMLVS